MSVHDMKALKKWQSLPKDLQEKVMNNVFCTECFETTIVDYTINDNEHGVLLKGKCKSCGADVARLVEDL